MTNNKKITPEQIRAMTPEEWQAFRIESWKRKQEYYSKPTPDWYLKDRNSYIQFVERLNKRKEFMVHNNSNEFKKGNLTKKVEALAGDDIDSFADDK